MSRLRSASLLVPAPSVHQGWLFLWMVVCAPLVFFVIHSGIRFVPSEQLPIALVLAAWFFPLGRVLLSVFGGRLWHPAVAERGGWLVSLSNADVLLTQARAGIVVSTPGRRLLGSGGSPYRVAISGAKKYPDAACVPLRFTCYRSRFLWRRSALLSAVCIAATWIPGGAIVSVPGSIFLVVALAATVVVDIAAADALLITSSGVRVGEGPSSMALDWGRLDRVRRCGSAIQLNARGRIAPLVFYIRGQAGRISVSELVERLLREQRVCHRRVARRARLQ